ncbi:MAG: hypothetical protein ABI298_05480 [Acidimicrobiales bacterium]
MPATGNETLGERHVPNRSPRPLTSEGMGVLKALLKVTFLIVVAATITGVVTLVKRPKDTVPVSFEEWPEVPNNPASE